MPQPQTTHSISPDFNYASHYVSVLGSKMHYVEEGAGDPVLFLHGNPTSSYLWRNIIPEVSPGNRCIAVDLIGMGQSDKPDLPYRFFDHAAYLDGFIEALGLKNITLVVHDWGSGLGFHYAQRNSSNVRAIAFMESIVAPMPAWENFPEKIRGMFQNFRTPETGWELIVNQNIFVEQILPGAMLRELSEQEMDAYRKPFLKIADRKPVYQWPNELSIAGEPEDTTRMIESYNAWLQETEIPKLLLHATPGALTPPPVVEWCKASFKNLKTVDLGQGLHFLQEDYPEQIGQEIADWIQAF